MFFPEEINVTKKGINIPWQLFFKSPTTKTISKTKNRRQSKKTSKTCAESILNSIFDQKSSASGEKNCNFIPDLTFPANPEICNPEKLSNPESLEFLLDTLSPQQNDLLHQAISSVQSAEPTEENFAANHSAFLTLHADHLVQPVVQNSVPTSAQISSYSTPITAEKSASVQSVPEISANQIHGNCQNLSFLPEQKLATAINNLTTKISILQNYFNCELETIKNDLKKLQKYQ
jgi:hypothetical protein